MTKLKPITSCIVLVTAPVFGAAGSPEGEEPKSPPPAFSLTEEDEQAADIWQALSSGTTKVDFRYRVESVDSDDPATPERALASTLRTTVSFETGSFHDLRGFIEFEDVTPIGAENYNDGINGMGDHPAIIDPDSTEVNQVYVGFEGVESLAVRVGRQQITLDNHRFVGNVGWRQNHQTFDAARATYTIHETTTVDYSLVHNVNRIFSDDNPAGDQEMSSHLLNVGHTIEGVGKASAYAYVLDYDDAIGMSTSTYGVRFAGTTGLGKDTDLLYAGEFAKQSDTGDNPTDVDTEYYLAELGATVARLTLRIGNEHLGGSGTAGDKFTTPLATLHKFNGFADVFLVTPDTGLEDLYVTLEGTLAGARCRATYHDFSSDAGSLDYGSEIDLDVAIPLTERVTLGVKAARFEGDDSFFDVTKLMAWIQVAAL